MDDHVTVDLETVKLEEDEFNVHENIMQFANTNQPPTWTDSVGELCKVKQETIDSGDCERVSKETKHWIVSEDGVLRQVKVEHTQPVSETRASEDCNRNVHQTQQWRSMNDEQFTKAQAHVRLNPVSTCRMSLAQSREESVLDSCSTSLIPYTRTTCEGGSLGDLYSLTVPPVTDTSQLYSGDNGGQVLTESFGLKHFTDDICEKSFTDAKDLKHDKKTHTGIKLYSCDTCGKSFRHPSVLKQHEITHAADKPFVCITCRKSFKTSGYLRRHESTHSGEKPYICVTCGRSFAQQSTMRGHEMTHAGERAYRCTVCGRAFINSSYLKMHAEKTHRREAVFLYYVWQVFHIREFP